MYLHQLVLTWSIIVLQLFWCVRKKKKKLRSWTWKIKRKCNFFTNETQWCSISHLLKYPDSASFCKLKGRKKNKNSLWRYLAGIRMIYLVQSLFIYLFHINMILIYLFIYNHVHKNLWFIWCSLCLLWSHLRKPKLLKNMWLLDGYQSLMHEAISSSSFN